MVCENKRTSWCKLFRLHVLHSSISLQNAFTKMHYISLILRNNVPRCKLIKLSYLRETTLNLSPNGLSNTYYGKFIDNFANFLSSLSLCTRVT